MVQQINASKDTGIDLSGVQIAQGHTPLYPDERSEVTHMDSGFDKSKRNEQIAVSTCQPWANRGFQLYGHPKCSHTYQLCSHGAANDKWGAVSSGTRWREGSCLCSYNLLSTIMLCTGHLFHSTGKRPSKSFIPSSAQSRTIPKHCIMKAVTLSARS